MQTVTHFQVQERAPRNAAEARHFELHPEARFEQVPVKETRMVPQVNLTQQRIRDHFKQEEGDILDDPEVIKRSIGRVGGNRVSPAKQ